MRVRIAVFATKLGWCGLVGADDCVHRLLFGHRAAAEVRDRAAAEPGAPLPESDWWPTLRQRLEAYAEGAPEDFRDVRVPTSGCTPFQSRVIRALRRVGFGETITYGALAARSGATGAARAVGSVMARNPVPLIVPCHRVVGAGGRLGGFSAPQGLAMKRQLLALERGVHPVEALDAAAC